MEITQLSKAVMILARESRKAGTALRQAAYQHSNEKRTSQMDSDWKGMKSEMTETKLMLETDARTHALLKKAGHVKRTPTIRATDNILFRQFKKQGRQLLLSLGLVLPAV